MLCDLTPENIINVPVCSSSYEHLVGSEGGVFEGRQGFWPAARVLSGASLYALAAFFLPIHIRRPVGGRGEASPTRGEIRWLWREGRPCERAVAVMVRVGRPFARVSIFRVTSRCFVILVPEKMV